MVMISCINFWTKYNVVTCLVTRHGVWIENRIYGFLKLVTTINYSAIGNSHNLQFTTAH
jgi:hypothetical protein